MFDLFLGSTMKRFAAGLLKASSVPVVTMRIYHAKRPGQTKNGKSKSFVGELIRLLQVDHHPSHGAVRESVEECRFGQGAHWLVDVGGGVEETGVRSRPNQEISRLDPAKQEKPCEHG
jgi:hypothetical protein